MCPSGVVVVGPSPLVPSERHHLLTTGGIADPRGAWGVWPVAAAWEGLHTSPTGCRMPVELLVRELVWRTSLGFL